MTRREFTRAVKVAIIKRSMGGIGEIRCENCSAPVFPSKRFEIDHRIPDAMEMDKSRKLTAADGWILCRKCHAEKTQNDVADIAKAKRREASHLGAKFKPREKPPRKPLRTAVGPVGMARRFR